MKRPVMLWPLVLVLLFFSLGGFYGGILMLMDPTGELLGVANILHLLPVPNFILPGIFLILVMGLFPLILAIALVARPQWNWADSLLHWSKHYWAWTSTIILVVIIALWLIFEGWFMGFYPITYATAVQGLLILIFALMPGVSRYFSLELSR